MAEHKLTAGTPDGDGMKEGDTFVGQYNMAGFSRF
jgi:hypothetical protein